MENESSTTASISDSFKIVNTIHLARIISRNTGMSFEASTSLVDVALKSQPKTTFNVELSLEALKKKNAEKLSEETLRELLNSRAESLKKVDSLSERQRQVLQFLIVERLPIREVAERLDISAYTVQEHLKIMYAKFKMNSRLELAALATMAGLISKL